MIEVFKTDITDKKKASLLIDKIKKEFPAYSPTFDLEDCDNILRINCPAGTVQSDSLIKFLLALECNAEILPENDHSFEEIGLVSFYESIGVSRAH